jgi:hypothetical protein
MIQLPTRERPQVIDALMSETAGGAGQREYRSYQKAATQDQKI